MKRSVSRILFCGVFACVMPGLALAAKEKDRPARPLAALKPEFPPELQAEGLGGVVTVEFLVEADGSINYVRTIGKPDPRLSVLAELAVARVPFEPAIVKGKPAPYGMTARVDFDALRGAPSTKSAMPTNALDAAAPSLFTSPLKFSDGPIELPKKSPAAPSHKPPRLIKEVQPVYPLKLRAKGVTGKVRLRFVVDKAGAVRDAEVIEASHRELGKAALEAINQWIYEPAERDGVKVNTRLEVPLFFDLKEKTTKAPAAKK
jgi:TonB family protein